jgi:hypothetical protein
MLEDFSRGWLFVCEVVLAAFSSDSGFCGIVLVMGV